MSVTTVVEDHVGPFAVLGQRSCLLGAPPVLLEGLALPGEDGDAGCGDGGGGVVLGGEDVARRPAHLGSEGDERLDEHRGLDGHVQRPGDAGAGEGAGVAVLGTQGHEPGHLDLGQVELAATEVGQLDVGHPVGQWGGGLGRDGVGGHRMLLWLAAVDRGGRAGGCGIGDGSGPPVADHEA